MQYSILCSARKGHKCEINHLALVDRAKNKRLFWTSDDPSIMVLFPSMELAQQALGRLKYNNPHIVLASHAVEVLLEQRKRIDEWALADQQELGWDAHKR